MTRTFAATRTPAGRRRGLVICLGTILATMAASAPARAETRRIAVIVGSNRGDAAHAPLRYAEQDATKMGAVLAELGGLSPEDVLLLRGPTVAAVRGAIDEGTRRVAAWHAAQHGQAVLLFYFSGHSDGQVLELGNEALPFAELRQRMTSSGAEVRLTIVDSCRSGALLALKGGTLGQAFDIRLADELASTGEVLIASSAADESALESSEIGASFFSHHLISGLRGAADLSGDGLVTLAEAYQYAFARTLRATSDTVVGPQHAGYDYHLAGRGDLVLTELRRPSAVLDLPSDFDRLLLLSSARQQVVAELGPRSAHRIALAAGDYKVRGWRGSHTFSAAVSLGQGQEIRLAAADLLPVMANGAAAKGGEPAAVLAATAIATTVPAPDTAVRWWALSAALGLSSGVADGAWLGVARLGFERAAPIHGVDRIELALLTGTGRTDGLRENRVGIELAPSWWIDRGRLGAGLGLGLGAGAAVEWTDGSENHWSGLGWASPTLRIELRLGRDVAVGVRAQFPVTLLRRDDHLTVAVLPFGGLEFSVRL